jgi:hypothetical protein
VRAARLGSARPGFQVAGCGRARDYGVVPVATRPVEIGVLRVLAAAGGTLEGRGAGQGRWAGALGRDAGQGRWVWRLHWGKERATRVSGICV